jgi:hypothetical protein
MHAPCMKRYAIYHTQHNTKQRTLVANADADKSVPCPLCRTDWPMAIIKADCKGKASLLKSSAPIKCSMCSATEKGAFYRCIECSCGYHRSSPRALGGRLQECAVGTVDTSSGEADMVSGVKDRSTYRKAVDICHSCFTFRGGSKIPDLHERHHFLTSEATGEFQN